MRFGQSPKKLVEQQYGGREAIVGAIVEMLDAGAQERRSLMHASNRKLLLNYAAAREARDRFGSKDELVDALGRVEYPSGKVPEGWQRRMRQRTTHTLIERYHGAAREPRDIGAAMSKW